MPQRVSPPSFTFVMFDNLLMTISQTDPNDPQGPDIDTKIDELKHAIRRAEVRFLVKRESREFSSLHVYLFIRPQS